MRNFLALGMAGSVVVGAMAACGDDDTGRGPGVGGSGGGAGTAGSAGAGGMGGTGGAAGGGGSAGAVVAPPPPPPDVSPQATCTGCIELIAPVVGPRSATNVTDEASYIFSLATPTDFSNAVITWRLAAVAPNANYSVVIFAQDGQPLNFAGAYSEIALDPGVFAANQFRDVSLDLTSIASVAGDAGAGDAGALGADGLDAGADGGADAGDAGLQTLSPPPNIIDAFDKSQITQFGIFVGVNEAFSGSATVRVAVDQVTITGVPGQPGHTFTTDAEGLNINQYNVPPGTPPPTHHP